MDASERAVAAAGNAAISKGQVRELILLAQAAYAEQARLGLADQAEGFDAWRRGALYDAVQKTSFREVTQREYGRAMQRFGELAGKTGGAAARRAGAGRAIAGREALDEGDRRRAMAALREACEASRDVFGEKAFWYASSLAEKIHKTPIDKLTAKQLWQVLFTVRSRAAAKRRADKKGERA